MSPSAVRSTLTLASASLLSVLLLLGARPCMAHDPEPPPPALELDATGEIAPSAPAHGEEVWGCTMCETVREDVPGTCPLCGMDLVRMNARGEIETAGAGAMPTRPPLMPGLPDGTFFAAALLVLALSFALLAVRTRPDVGAGPRRSMRWDLMRLPGFAWLVGRPWLRVALQVPMVALFLLVVVAGLFGTPAPERNIAPVLTWTIWWACLAIVVAFGGKIWCLACPWTALADWSVRLPLLRRMRGPRGEGWRWPKPLRNIWIATGLFVGLTWLELGYGVTAKPWLTAVLGLFMVFACVGTVLAFERRAFCRYACLVGRVSGLYSLFAVTELRARDKSACRSCSSKACYHGSEKGTACPTHQFLGSMEENTYCILCLECVRTCPEKNVSWNVRSPAADLFESRKPRLDEAYLAVVMLSMSAFHGLTMTPSWEVLIARIEAAIRVGRLAAFSLGMAGMLVLPFAVYFAICMIMKRLARDVDRSASALFVSFAYSLLPIALFYHLAHNTQHLFFEGKKLVRAASDPFGWGWDLLGTAHMPIDAVLPVHASWSIQVCLILIGHIYGIWIAHRIACRLYDSPRLAVASQIPMLLGMLLFSWQSLWLLSQPMVMRTAM